MTLINYCADCINVNYLCVYRDLRIGRSYVACMRCNADVTKHTLSRKRILRALGKMETLAKQELRRGQPVHSTLDQITRARQEILAGEANLDADLCELL